jgi:hypothetical protein
VYEVFGTTTEDDKYLFTAASVDDAAAACERHNAIIGHGVLEERLKKLHTIVSQQKADMMSTLLGFYNQGYNRGLCLKTIKRNGGDA